MASNKTRAHMSREDRAKQFMPFAALKGYEEALRSKEKIIVPKVEFSEEYAQVLNEKMGLVKKGSIITVTYFYRGEYIKKTGIVVRMDESARLLQVVNVKIPFDDIYDISDITTASTQVEL